MNSCSDPRVRARLYAMTAFFVSGLGAPLAATAEDGVLITGFTAQFGGPQAAISDSALSREQLCGPDGAASMLNSMNQVGDRLGERLSGGGFSAGDRASEAEAVRSEMCQRDEPFSLEAYAMTFVECRMTMDTPSMVTDIRMATGDEPVVMTMGDYYRAEASRMALDSSMQVPAAGGISISDINWVGPGDTKQIAGHSTTRWNFDFETGMGDAMAGMEAMGISAKISTTGYGYFSDNLPGMGIVQSFYGKFVDSIQAQQGSSMFGGMMKSMVEMLAKGVPLEMEQTMESGFAMGGSGGMKTLNKATGLRAVTLPGDICSRTMIPDYFAVSDMNEQMQGMGDMGGAAGQQMPGMSELNQSMGGLSEAMEQMSPEQREALQGLGLGSLFGGGNDANPAGQPAQAPAQSAPAARSGPSSSELTTDDMTQSVQLHLQALGYTVGNTSGDLDTDTIIAISQFQAENGLKPSGEVSPQLLGVLGARVDNQ